MKKVALIVSVLFSFQAQAISWKIFGACKNSPIHQGVHEVDFSKSVGQISIEIFEQNKIPYVGAAEGLNSILNSPIGLESIEVVSDREMRVYGWCYTVNGKQPLEMPHKVYFETQEDRLIWFYGYSTNKDNEWIDYCQPAYWIKAQQFCGR